MRKTLPSRLVAVLICVVLAGSLSLRGGPTEVRSGDRLSYALTGARVIVSPGRVIENGVVVVRGGVIEAVGAQGQTAIPADARVFDLRGKVLHAASSILMSPRTGWRGNGPAARATTKKRRIRLPAPDVPRRPRGRRPRLRRTPPTRRSA